MAKKEKQDRSKTNATPDPILNANPKTLKDDPDGETICSADFAEGCVNGDDDITSSAIKQIGDDEKMIKN